MFGLHCMLTTLACTRAAGASAIVSVFRWVEPSTDIFEFERRAWDMPRIKTRNPSRFILFYLRCYCALIRWYEQKLNAGWSATDVRPDLHAKRRPPAQTL